MATQKYFKPLVPSMPTKLTVCISRESFEKVQSDWNLSVSEKQEWRLGGETRALACTYDFDGLVVVCLTPDTKPGSIAHESVHVFEIIMRDIGERTPSDEFRAYGTQAIFETITQELERLKKVLDVSPKN